MVHEKIFTVGADKQVKMIVRGYYSHLMKIEPFVEVWIREAGETNFYSPTELNLPKYGRVERPDEQQVRDQVVRVSGISDQQFNQVVKEFKEITSSSVLW